jgi:cell division protein FtsQ
MVNAYTVLESSDLKVRDYALSVALHKGQYERAAAKASKIIESTTLTYQFPNDFKLAVKEYQPVAYIMANQQYVTVYANGYFDMAVTLPEDKIDKALFTIEKLTTPSDVKALLTAIKTLKPDISSLITKVTLDPTEATKDMVDIDMSDGNQVRVPLSQIELKMPYYTSVASQLTVDSVVDMEAGIYAKSKQAYADELKQKAEEKKKAEEEAAQKKAEEEANGETSDESSTSSSETSESAE